MIFKHLFKVALSWGNAPQPLLKKTYNKTHRISITDKPDLIISAAKAFKGDSALYNPEDLLLSSLVSCHMMSYLYVCAQNNIEVHSYTDQAEATLETQPDGSGRFTKVVLNPVVVIADPSKIELALSLHSKANKLCFIANSCNFPVTHNATCSLS
ncbi:MAG: OsmC family protein [Sphingobacterium sp.]|jgi:organic hydroperoxide reductase OsmC/OhrA|nr:OsmC family protein [Sphingobacterium sp.]